MKSAVEPVSDEDDDRTQKPGENQHEDLWNVDGDASKENQQLAEVNKGEQAALSNQEADENIPDQVNDRSPVKMKDFDEDNNSTDVNASVVLK